MIKIIYGPVDRTGSQVFHREHVYELEVSHQEAVNLIANMEKFWGKSMKKVSELDSNKIDFWVWRDGKVPSIASVGYHFIEKGGMEQKEGK